MSSLGRVLVPVLITWLSICYVNESLSACDEVDAFFYLDKLSLKNNFDSVKQFILDIVWRGSSEHAAFSIAVYGEGIDFKMDHNGGGSAESQMVKISLEETQKIEQRTAEKKKIEDILEGLKVAVQVEDTGKKSKAKTKNAAKTLKPVSIIDAFKAATKNIPPSVHKKKQFLGSNFDKNAIGTQDGRRAHFVFDYENKFIADKKGKAYFTGDSNDDLCKLFSLIQETDKESFHFLMGQEFDRIDVICNGSPVKEPLITQRTFYHLKNVKKEQHYLEQKRKEGVFGITCPGKINIANPDWTPANNKETGSIILATHNQWIDPKTVKKCNLVYKDHDNNKATPDILDEKKSYIEIEDDPKSDNTFIVGDYLLSDPKTFEELKKKGCKSPVYKIVKLDAAPDKNRNFKLNVALPLTPLEYIRYANVKGDVEVKDTEKVHDKNKKGKRRRLPSRDVKLLDFKDEWEKNFVKTEELPPPKISTPTGQSLEFKAGGTINITTGYNWHLKANLYFNFWWNVFKGTAHIEFKMYGSWGLGAKFSAEFSGHVEAILQLLDFGHTFTFFIGPVPVVVRPYIKLSGELKTLPFKLKLGIDCQYKEKFQLGYKVDRKRVAEPKYSRIASGKKFLLAPIETFNGLNIKQCAAKAYLYGSGRGRTCKWFDHNPNDKICRCMGSRKMRGHLGSVAGWNAYILNYKCNGQYAKQCKGCHSGDVWLKKIPFDCQIPWYDFWSDASNWVCLKCKKAKADIEYPVEKEKIWSRKKDENNGCKKTLKYNDESLLGETCPKIGSANPMGFDVTITPQIGISLYVVINVFVDLEIKFPARVHLPVLDVKVESNGKCTSLSKEETNEICNDSKQMYIAVSVEGEFNPKIGIELALNQLSQYLPIDLDIKPIKKSMALGGPIQIMDKRYKCWPLKTELFGMATKIVQQINTHLHRSCCNGNKLKDGVKPAMQQLYDVYVEYEDEADDEYNDEGMDYYDYNGNDYYNLRLLTNKKTNKFNTLTERLY